MSAPLPHAQGEFSDPDLILSFLTPVACLYKKDSRALLSLSRAFFKDVQLTAAIKDVPGPRGRTRLMHACWVGNYERAKFLLDRGANPNAVRPTDGYSCLMHAAEKGHAACCAELLKRGADPNARDGWKHDRTSGACAR